MTEINQGYATGEEVGKIAELMHPILETENPIHVLLAMLSLCFVLQDPDIDPDTLSAGVKGASEWIALFLSASHDSAVTPKEKLN